MIGVIDANNKRRHVGLMALSISKSRVAGRFQALQTRAWQQSESFLSILLFV